MAYDFENLYHTQIPSEPLRESLNSNDPYIHIWMAGYFIQIALIIFFNYLLIHLILFHSNKIKPFMCFNFYKKSNRRNSGNKLLKNSSITTQKSDNSSPSSFQYGTNIQGRKRGIKKTRINLLIAWLSFTDMLLALICLPLYLHYEYFANSFSNSLGPEGTDLNASVKNMPNSTMNIDMNRNVSVITKLHITNLSLIDSHNYISYPHEKSKVEPPCSALIAFYFFNNFSGFNNSLITAYIAFDRFRAIHRTLKFKRVAMPSPTVSINSENIGEWYFPNINLTKIYLNYIKKLIFILWPQILISSVCSLMSLPLVLLLFQNKCILNNTQERCYLLYSTISGLIIPLIVTCGFYARMIMLLSAYKFNSKSKDQKNHRPDICNHFNLVNKRFNILYWAPAVAESIDVKQSKNVTENYDLKGINVPENNKNRDVKEMLQPLCNKIDGCTSLKHDENNKHTRKDDYVKISNVPNQDNLIGKLKRGFHNSSKSQNNKIKAIRMTLALILTRTVLSTPLISFQILEIAGYIKINDYYFRVEILRNAMNIFCLTDRWLNVVIILMFCNNYRLQLKRMFC
ncbi:unnamed protein product [Gordionus sp. m RMFG-2023]|uniref:uncharacterized protein LOC135923217 n=1 Tax=Gordionus sp. m RMFG-2023 TaxID=3053472 RepID=UPI0030E21833